MKATSDEGCNGCKHREDQDGWCYMFEQRPEETPCGQHDMYAAQRRLNGQRLINHPHLMFQLIGKMSGR